MQVTTRSETINQQLESLVSLKYSCPKCGSRLEFQKTFDRKIHIMCTCGIGSILEYNKNPDLTYLEFLSLYDSGALSNESASMKGLVRDEGEIREMIKDHKLDKITMSILLSKKDYVSQFKVLKYPEPEMGVLVDKMGLDESIITHLKKSGIKQFYKFQENAIRDIIYGENIVIEAPTASGKTEAFLIPIVHKIKKKSQSGRVLAIFVYPTKSLSRDQLPKIQKIADAAGIRVGIFDGDTKLEERREILENPPEILVTNFDVLHYHLWHQTKLISIVSTTETLIVDEAHVYSGIFGSNVHYILKRLKRVCKSLQIIAASATLDNAEEFCERLFGMSMHAIRGSGRKGETDFAILFPSLRTPRALMISLTKQLTDKNHKTMVFSNSHLNSELLAIQARRQNINIKVHRAGLMVNYRKSVEREFKEGSLQAISCTPTLELGIDVGNVDGVISSPVPINRLVQRIGRAARAGQHGFAFLVLGNDPISQYYKTHPDDYFEDIERYYIDPKNPFVERIQVLAMACDRPISKHELGEHAEIIQQHLKEGNLIMQNNRILPNLDKISSTLNKYSIRGIGGSVDIFLNEKKVGERVLPMAIEELHKDAIYFLAGIRYKVSEFEYPRKNYAKLKRIPRDHPYYTRALTTEWPTIRTIYEKRRAFGVQVAFCELLIEKQVCGYANIELGQDVTQGEKVQFDTPLEYDFVTKGIVFSVPTPITEIQKADDGEYVLVSGCHATEHVMIEGSNMITRGASQDLGGISLGNSRLIFIYDGAIGGSGASKALYDRFEKALQRSMHIVAECPCSNEAGCPRCTFSYRCGNNNEFLHKNASIEILRRIVDGERTEIGDSLEGDRPLV